MDKEFDRAVEEFCSHLDEYIPLESGTFNKFCPNCYCRNGHPLIWCRACGTKMVVYTDLPTQITWRQYLLKEASEYEQRDRWRQFLREFTRHSLGKGGVQYPFVWYVDDPNCTTPKFIQAIQERL